MAKNKRFVLLLVWVMMAFCLTSLKAQLTINTTINPPYPTDLDYYLDDLSNVFINITNTSATTHQFRFSAMITGPAGIEANVGYLGAPIVIGPGQTLLYTGNQISALGSTTGGFENTNNLSPEQLEAITLHHVLPEGNYTICFFAYDPNEQLLSDPSSGCAQFEISYIERPQIVLPSQDEVVSTVLNVVWQHDISGIAPLDRSRIQYRFNLIDATLNDLGFYIDEVYDLNLAGTYQQETHSMAITLNPFTDVQLVEGHEYVCFVTAFDPEGRLMFLDRGNSNIVHFYYQQATDDEEDDLAYLCIEEEAETTDCAAPACDFYFPSHGDTIPFSVMPFIIKMNPYCTDYRRLHYEVRLRDNTSSSFIYNRDDDLAWGSGGPLQYLLDRGISDANEERASMFMVNETSTTPALVRSKSYTADVEASMRMRSGSTFQYQIHNTFVSGMPQPGLVVPEHQDTMAPGNVLFRWDNGALPLNPFPDVFYLLRMHGHSIEDQTYYGPVKERWILQVARTREFNRDDIVTSITESVEATQFTSVEDLMTGIYIINERTRAISEEGTYYYRVVWLKDPDQNLAGLQVEGNENRLYVGAGDFYHSSSIREFTLENDRPVSVVEEEDEEGACASPCTFPPITSTTAAGTLTEGSSFTAAGFDVTVDNITGAGSGAGTVTLPFLNNIKIRVNFTSIQINSSRQMIAGTIRPMVETAIPMSEHVSGFGRLFGMDETSADAMEAGLEAGGKLMSLLTSGSTVSLPIGIDKEISGTKIIIGITNVNILKDSASMDLVVNIRLPNLEVVNGFVSLGAQVCITRNGFGNDVRLYLPQDQVFPMGNDNEFRIKGAEGASDPRNITSVEWDCNGFRALNLVGAVRFTRDWMLPENAAGQILPTGNVEARFGGRFVNGGHVMVRIDMDAFQLPGAEGWGFQPGHNVWIDLSDLENPTGFQAALPPHYEHASISEEGMRNTWKGFFMEELSVRTPERLQGPDRNRLTFALRNMFIDNTGITFSARAENVLRWDGDGNFNGWAVSLDTIYFDILQNNFRRAGFNGKIGLPIAEQSQYMLYQAELQHRRDSFNFVMSVRPVDNIRIPISMAQAVIRNDSYIRASLGSENFIEANLCASLGIGNSNLPAGQTMPSSVRLPQIVIENLRLNSETGFDTTDFAFSLTGMEGMSRGPSSGGGGQHYEDERYPEWMVLTEEGESTMSGFPIGLDHFSFSNDRITLQPRLTLTGGDGGFSAAAKISLLVNMDLMSSPQRFDLTGVNLDRIDLDIEASDIKLAGYLEFYKTAIDEGVRGGITLEMKLGIEVGIDINADFGCRRQPGALVYNTSEWYSYFYVDGTAVLSPGITLFSGVSLYGLGGGFYHHMRMTTDLPNGSSVMATSGPRQASGVRYEPYFDTDLGLKFKVILGSNDNGKAYNLDVQLLAEFSFRHGLTLLDLKGSFRVMTDGISVSTIGRAGNSPVAGYVGMTLNLPPGGPATFNGQFFVKVKVPYDFPVLTGLGSIPNPPPGWTAENAMVWANFYAGPDKWYFHMGNPTNRCGVRLGLGDITLMRVTNYMMIGHDIPVTMPEPDAEFVRIFERGIASGSDFTSLDGDVNTLMEGAPRDSVPLGTGFAFGISMAMNTGDIEFFPFFFNLGAVMGCDINVTHATPEADRRCAGSDRVPGIDGWYATGQFYAGIEGAFGIKINLFVTEIKATIFEASAAMILKGGLPNPEWVSGRGSFYYNVCDGLAEGRCNFTFEAGTVCSPVTGNPFAGIGLIQDVSPANGATDVSVYTNASAAFSMQMNRVFEIEEYVSSTDPPVIRRLQPYMYAFELKKRGSSAVISGSGNWIENNRVYDFAPINVLQAETAHTIRVEARIRENGRDLTSGGRVYREERIHEFTTGAEPNKIVNENLSFTYPYINQQNFLKAETRSNEGYVRCKRANNSFLREGDVSNVTTSFYARFTDGDGNSFSSPIRIMRGERGVIFTVDQLQNDKLYCVQIIRKDRPNGTLFVPGGSSALGAINASVINTSLINTSLQIVNFAATIGNNTIQSNQFKRITLPAGKVSQYETELYAYFFKTSKYNRLVDKIRAEQPAWDNRIITFGYELGRVEKLMDESFEWTDADSFKVVAQSDKQFTPRIRFFLEPVPDVLDGTAGPTAVPVNAYLREIVAPRITQNYTRMLLERADIIRRTMAANPGSTLLCPNIMPISGMRIYDRSVGFASNSYRMQPLTQNQINGAFTTAVNSGGIAINVPLLTGLGGLSLPALSGRNFNTVFRYEPTITGTDHYKELRREAMIFAHSLVTIRSTVGSFLVTNYELMTMAQKRFFDEHINRSRLMDQIRHMNWTKGPQTIGLQYLYPDENGNDVLGSVSPFVFRL